MTSVYESSTKLSSASASTPIDIDSPTDLKDVEDGCILPRTSRHTSEVWDHFVRKRLLYEVKAKCNYCKNEFAGGARAGTTDLSDHLKICMKRQCTDIRQSRLFGSVVSTGDKKETLSLTNIEFRENDGSRDLADMVILHEYPLSMVDHYSFRKYSKTLQPRFTVPTRTMVKKDILERYDEERDIVGELIKKAKGRMTLTIDIWTSSNQKKGYMTITAHFIDNSWTLQSRILRGTF